MNLSNWTLATALILQPKEIVRNRLLESSTKSRYRGGESSEVIRYVMSASAMESAVATALRSVISRAHMAAERSGWSPEKVRVVAVSKTKPVSVIQQVYDAGHRVFGENYVQELVEKSPQLPADIEWHFIGNLQSNKVKALLGAVPNLVVVESVDDKKIANHLDRAVANLGRKPLKVLVQVNTSGEESKYGVEPSECVELAKHVKLGCPNLIFSGLMTIGMLDYSSTPENFKALCKCRTEVCEALGISEEQCELSMGMSADFEQAMPLLEPEMAIMASSHATSKFNNNGLRFKNKNCHCGGRCAVKISEYTKNNDMLYYCCATKECGFFEWCYPHISDSHTRQELEDPSDANSMQPRSEDIIRMQMHDEIKRNAQDIMKLNITINYIEKICVSCLVCCVICLLVTVIRSIYK